MKYYKDPVVEEVRKVREDILKEYDYNPHAFGKVLAEREQKRRHRRKTATLPRKHSYAGIAGINEQEVRDQKSAPRQSSGTEVSKTR